MHTSLLALFLSILPGAEADTLAVDTLVVCPPGFRPALEPWVEYRESQAHRVAVVGNDQTAAEILDHARRLAARGKLQAVLLVGDAPPPRVSDRAFLARAVPTHHAAAKVNVKFGSEPEIASDNWYGDLDGDGVPELAVGRLPADSPADLEVMVDKILAYERTGGDDLWRRRLNLVAGAGGFGPVADFAITAAARSILTQGVPAAYETTMTYANCVSPYCPEPARINEAAVARLNEGCLFWVYMGHSLPRSLYPFRTSLGDYRMLDCADAARLDARHAPPIALFLSCYSGAFDGRRDCLAEEMLAAPGGPVAVIAGSRLTMPYGTSAFGCELLREYFGERRATLGELLLHARRNLLLADREGFGRGQLDLVAALLNPAGGDLAAERAEHVQLFNLLGDPWLRLEHPEPAELEVPSTVAAGEVFEVTGTSPVDGQALVELVVPRDRLTFRPPVRRAGSLSPESLAEYAATYTRANDPRLASVRVPVVEGRFRASLSAPSGVSGPCHIRLFIQSPYGFAAASADLSIAPSAPPR